MNAEGRRYEVRDRQTGRIVATLRAAQAAQVACDLAATTQRSHEAARNEGRRFAIVSAAGRFAVWDNLRGSHVYIAH
jgi:hypothetical protein